MLYALLALTPLLMVSSLFVRRFEKRRSAMSRTQLIWVSVGVVVQVAAIFVIATAPALAVKQSAYTAWLLALPIYTVNAVSILRTRFIQVRDQRK